MIIRKHTEMFSASIHCKSGKWEMARGKKQISTDYSIKIMTKYKSEIYQYYDYVMRSKGR